MEITADCALLRHALATLAYRASRALDEAPEEFAAYPGAGKKPIRILAHMGDLMGWVLSMAKGQPAWHEAEALAWVAERQRFFAALTAFDQFLASGAELKAPAERLLQGPVADALTHVGQLAMLRRMAGCPAWGENFYLAEIHAGQTQAEQPAPVKKFR
ncbi:MAG: hypothetical protein P4L03_03420 [Terracidiphilus sp.]|nr:hypothetical protein [Terracidiphilus sp.]